MHLLSCQLINHILHCHKLSVHVASFYFHPLITGSDQCLCVRIMRPLSSFLWSPSVVDLIRHQLKQPLWGAAAAFVASWDCIIKHIHQQWGLWFHPLVKSGVKAETSRDTLMYMKTKTNSHPPPHVCGNRSRPGMFGLNIIIWVNARSLNKTKTPKKKNEQWNYRARKPSCKIQIPSKAVQ